jgi:hypothetical protein
MPVAEHQPHCVSPADRMVHSPQLEAMAQYSLHVWPVTVISMCRAGIVMKSTSLLREE